MMETIEDEIARLGSQEQDLVLPRFEASEAWALGSILMEKTEGAPVTIDIRKPGQVLFHVARTGATPDNDEWVRRKAGAALRFETSSLILRLKLPDLGTPGGGGWFDPADVVFSGGSIPIRVRGAGVVAVATVSGLDDREDHALVAESIQQLRRNIDEHASTPQLLDNSQLTRG